VVRDRSVSMKGAAIGIRMHSGWGAFLVASGDPVMIEVIDRRRIVVADPNIPGASQPYHCAAKMGLSDARKYLSNCAKLSEHLALTAVGTVVRDLHSGGYRVIRSAVLLASGRRLPSLVETLASHPLIHTAEGEFFRTVFWRACERLDIPVTEFESAISRNAPMPFSGTSRLRYCGEFQS
jgi:hypothetical protein